MHCISKRIRKTQKQKKIEWNNFLQEHLVNLQSSCDCYTCTNNFKTDWKIFDTNHQWLLLQAWWTQLSSPKASPEASIEWILCQKSCTFWPRLKSCRKSDDSKNHIWFAKNTWLHTLCLYTHKRKPIRLIFLICTHSFRCIHWLFLFILQAELGELVSPTTVLLKKTLSCITIYEL